MAKKTAKKKAAPTKKAATRKGPKKKSVPQNADELVGLKLDDIEQKAVDLVATSDELCNDLEVAVTAAVAKTVGTIYRKHKIKLNPAQAETVALVLFGN